MCLSRVTTVHEKPKLKQFYKVMYRVRRKGKPNLYHFQFRSCGPITKDETRRSSKYTIRVSSNSNSWYSKISEYWAGFHGYTSLRRAARNIPLQPNRRKTCERKFKGLTARRVVVLCEGLVRTVGSQGFSRVVVADSMKILREVPLTDLAKARGIKFKKKKKVS